MPCSGDAGGSAHGSPGASHQPDNRGEQWRVWGGGVGVETRMGMIFI